MLKKVTRWILIGMTAVNLTLALTSMTGYACLQKIKQGGVTRLCCGENCTAGGCSGSCTREELIIVASS